MATIFFSTQNQQRSGLIKMRNEIGNLERWTFCRKIYYRRIQYDMECDRHKNHRQQCDRRWSRQKFYYLNDITFRKRVDICPWLSSHRCGWVVSKTVKTMNEKFAKNVGKIFEDIFIHIFTRFPQVIYWNKYTLKIWENGYAIDNDDKNNVLCQSCLI